MRIATALALSLATASIQAAGIPESIEAIPMADCNIQTVAGVVGVRDSRRQVELSKQGTIAMQAMLKASSSAKNDGKSVGSQMNDAEKQAFAEARIHKISIDMTQLIESNFARDMDSIVSLVKTADTRYRWETVLNEDNPDYVYQAKLDLMEIGAPNPEVTTPAPSKTCKMEIALHAVEEQSLRRFDKMDNRAGFAWLKIMQGKYKMDKLDRSKFSPADADSYDLMRKMYFDPIQKEARLYQDIEHIKLIAKAGLMTYENSKKDMSDSGGNAEQIGATFKKLVGDKKIDRPLSSAFYVRDLIEKKKPSRMMTQLQYMSKEIERINKEHPVSD